ncbi:MAG: acyl-ACP--UDP-N-acetylglucosamine O-acyltransferase [Chitinispirillaceae bacterium]|nr:acyl-ACP--UDP-N-acetylglucosamine O-acyltransferase [Chitinispirillaceae bacterium]
MKRLTNSTIHPTAVIAPGARIGVDVKIGPYTVIEDDVIIGDCCDIGSHVVIGEGTRLGDECRVFKGAAVGLIPQDKKFAGEKTYAVIGKNTLIREFVTINRGSAARGETRIGSDCWIMAYCHIAHDCIIGDDVTISNSLAMAGHVEIGNHVTIGGICSFHQFTHVGDHAFIQATSYITQDVLPFALTGADPLRIVDINKIGLERHGFSEKRRRDIKRAFKILFRENRTLDDAIVCLEGDFNGNPDVAQLVAFMKNSTRGLMRMNEK